ncbi:uncharacterized protein KY384_001648 [Bacidia gigantensis]|uniref:uncharacterized protein n=1 Tax=Bacidia gigantensis TaxID=2732470 RepID=UPI001D047629|nr:uncharacterized protein KY384_001648 [Bacidia gigantensis]KAG8533907.1 hypothetical protein KY384_001648 [Bacidia gigantensis]
MTRQVKGAKGRGEQREVERERKRLSEGIMRLAEETLINYCPTGLYTDESPGLKVDPVVVFVLSLGFIFSVVALHIIAKISRKFS